MIGAIIGDVVGSRFEFNNIKTKKFNLFSNETRFTDDTAMTIALADVCNSKDFSNDNIIDTMKKWGKRYPNAGYGRFFFHWVLGSDRQPFYSCGNGAAMRISSVGWVAKSEEEVKDLSYKLTAVTHNHPEGLKGAETVAMCIYYAKIGKSKQFIKEYCLKQYPEIANLDYNELVANYKHEHEICQVTVPQALYCFLISRNFEDCLRTTISIGGDCDTTASMSCGIAEAFYGIPYHIKKKVLRYLPNDMINVIREFNKLYK